MRVISRAQQIKITGTPEHEKRKEAMRNRKQDLRAKIAASPSLKNLTSEKTSKILKRRIKMGLTLSALSVIDAYTGGWLLF